MKGLFSAFLNRNQSDLEIADSQSAANPFAPLRDRIKDRSQRRKQFLEDGALAGYDLENAGRIQRMKKKFKIMVGIIPKEEFVLTRFHPHLIQPMRNDRKFPVI